MIATKIGTPDSANPKMTVEWCGFNGMQKSSTTSPATSMPTVQPGQRKPSPLTSAINVSSDMDEIGFPQGTNTGAQHR